ncbi:hypothetical protein OAN307_c20380 [Octadecabacter antarcticus 307]|uniref:YjiS-like domain-containing protein n=1 Tax=Octadecabacter antarcticus 307 TaxID=391626 RepID=M9R7D3_9RHOB|nr:DUF1127 domain-containing protein [Octadecabacter antarcticus]AGI67678.1 hypothetical protein OAN307_c20380 [Octadecabacter antarcticus 307]
MTMVVPHTNSWLTSGLTELLTRYVSRRNAAANAKIKTAKYQRSLTKLKALSNRDLLDIGISRADIPLIAFEQSQKELANENA